jgi:hypothetical protein
MLMTMSEPDPFSAETEPISALHERIRRARDPLRAARTADPGYVPPVESDWRDQAVADVEEVRGDTHDDQRDRGGVRQAPE